MGGANAFHLAVATALLVAGCGGSSQANRAGLPLLTVEQAIQVGRAAGPSFEDLAGGRIDRPPVEAYVRTIGQRVARSAPRRELPYQFAVLDSAEVRGFALPGGSIYLTRGLLVRLATEGELAAALAHQLAHVGAQQVAPALCREHGKGLLLDAAAAAASARAGRAARQNDEALARLAKAVHAHEYAPEAEAAADRLGLDYLVAAGYNPSGMVGFLEALAASAAAGGPAAREADLSGRAARVRKIIERKYRDAAGRVADEEYRGEVLNRLTAR